MKSFTRLPVVLIVAAAVGITSCEKDNNDSPSSGSTGVGNTQRLISVGFGDDSTSLDDKYEYTYEDGRITRIDILSHNEDEWINTSKVEYSYSADYVEGVYYGAVEMGDTIKWEMENKNRYRHDSQGRVTDYTFYDEYFFDYPEPRYRLSFHYENGRLKEQVYQRWSIDHFVDRNKLIFMYENGQLTSVVRYAYENGFWYITLTRNSNYEDGRRVETVLWEVDSELDGDTLQSIISRSRYEYSGTKLSSLERFHYEDGDLAFTRKFVYFYNEQGNIAIVDRVYDSGNYPNLSKEFYQYENGTGNYRQLNVPTDFIPPEPQPKSQGIYKKQKKGAIPSPERFIERSQ